VFHDLVNRIQQTKITRRFSIILPFLVGVHLLHR
jgi:hypothetical protein